MTGLSPFLTVVSMPPRGRHIGHTGRRAAVRSGRERTMNPKSKRTFSQAFKACAGTIETEGGKQRSVIE